MIVLRAKSADGRSGHFSDQDPRLLMPAIVNSRAGLQGPKVRNPAPMTPK
jgi:hypothetical protein